MKFLKFKFNKIGGFKKGLTLVETLVAISILTISVIGPLGIIAQALHTSYYTRDQMTAYYLAQEAVEYVRNLRDNQGLAITKAYLAGTADTSIPNWLNIYSAGSTDNKIFGTDATLPPYGAEVTRYSLVKVTTPSPGYVFKTCPSNDVCDYMTKGATGIFGDISTGATTTQFRREIYFQKLPQTQSAVYPLVPQEFKMVVNVYWKSGSSLAKFTLEEYFTNASSKTGQ